MLTRPAGAPGTPHFYQRSHVPSVFLLSFLFGTTIVVSRFIIGQFHPFTYVAIRVSAAAVVATAWMVARTGCLPTGFHIWSHGAVVGVFATAAPMVGAVTSMRFQSSGVTSLCVALTPMAAMVCAHFVLEDDRLTTRKAVGALVSLAGVVLLIISGETGLGRARWEGFAIVLAGVAMDGYGIVHTRKHLALARSEEITVVRLITAALVVLPLAWVVDGFDFTRVRWSGLLAVTYAVFPGALFGFFVYSFVAARFGPSRATQTEYLIPVFAVGAGALFLGERITPPILIGMAVVFSGIAVATSRRARGLSHSAQTSR